jgi:hypothetical protein
MNPIVLMFGAQFRPLIGGAERQAETIAVALAEIGTFTGERICRPRS